MGRAGATAKWVRMRVAVFFVDYGEEGVGVAGGGLLESTHGAEVLDEALAGAGAYAGDGVKLVGAVSDLAALAMVGDGPKRWDSSRIFCMR